MALHDDEITADAALVTRLLADQAPAFAGTPGPSWPEEGSCASA